MRIHVAAWRDLDHPESGGSEVHLDQVTRCWVAAGHEVTVRTVATPNADAVVRRGAVDGRAVMVTRRGGRLSGVARVAAASAVRRDGPFDLAVDVWNGMPFFSPLWARRRLVVLHHLHGPLWPAAFGPVVGGVGRVLERSAFPLLYRRSQIATLAAPSRDELLADTRLRPERVHVVEPGVDPAFRPSDEDRSGPPTVLVVARFQPLKRVPLAVDWFARVRQQVPAARLVVVGDGHERADVEAAVRRNGLDDAVELRGTVDQESLVAAFRSAAVLVSASTNEGWGMTITEAAACGVPAVVSPCTGHRAALGPGAGVLANDDEAPAAIVRLLSDPGAWSAASTAALAHAAERTWERTASELLAVAT